MSNFKFIETIGAPIKAWVKGVPVEPAAEAQLRNMAGLPFICKHVAVMPDLHLGKGATVGSAIPTKGATVPAAVGVDIGCGMSATMTDLVANDLPDSLVAVRKAIDGKHSGLMSKTSPAYQLGTLGGGNHFKDPAYLAESSTLFGDYVEAVGWAQDYARVNRDLILAAVIDAIAEALGRTIAPSDFALSCHHNDVAKDEHFGDRVWVTGKGAVRAGLGELGIIPGSMGARSYIVRGRGNPDSLPPAPMGRNAPSRAPRRSAASRSRTMCGPRRASSAARTPAPSTRLRRPTRTSTP